MRQEPDGTSTAGSPTTPATPDGSPADAPAGVLRRDGRTDAFFDGAAEGRLVVKRCGPCDRWFGPDAGGCPGCGADTLSWAEAQGTATLVTWAVSHGRPEPGGTGPEPAVLALVELAEGPWLHARLTGLGAVRPHEGQPLRARFVRPGHGEPYVLFEPA